MKQNTSQIIPGKSSTFEKIMYAIGGAGGGSFCWSFISGFMTLYYTNSVGIAAGTVGTMMLIARLLDGVSDVGMGIILEKTNTRLGKARPWYLVSAPLLAIIMFLCFNVPQGFSQSGKIAYMYITYILVAAGAYTIYCMSDSALMARMSNDPADINNISSLKFFFILGLATPAYILANSILMSSGGNTEQGGWTKVSMLYAVIAFVTITLGGIFVKEKVPQDVPAEGNKGEKIPLKVVLGACVKAPEFFVLLILFFFSYTMSGIMSASSMYYVGYVIQDFGAVAYTSTIAMFGQIVPIVAMPFILKRVDKVKLLRVSTMIGGIAGLLRLLAPENLLVYLGGTLALTVCNVPMMVCMWTLIPDLVFYVAKKTGIRVDGFASMVGSIGVKVGTGVGAALVGWILEWGGFNGLVAEQPESAINAIILLAVVLTSLGMIAQSIVMFFWKLDKKMAALEAEENS